MRSLCYNRRMWSTPVVGKIARPTAFLCSLLVFLLLIYRPANTIFRSTGDVSIYQAYAAAWLDRPMSLPREYPPLTIGIFVVPQLVSATYYMLGFAVLAALATWLTVLLVDRLSRRGWWFVLYLALGTWGILFFRFDIFVVLLTVLAFASATRQRWIIAQVLLGFAVALKFYAVILMPLVVLWEWRDSRRLPIRSVLSGGISLCVAVGSMWLVAPVQMAGMLSYHRDRPLEIESVAAGLAWLVGPTQINNSFGSINVISPLSPVLIPLLTAANVLLLLALYGCFLKGYVNPPMAWVLALLISIATSKVFSTQYLLWVLPFVVIAAAPTTVREHDRRVSVYLWSWAGICILTSLIYPVSFTMLELGTATSIPTRLMILVVLRNIFLLGACYLSLRLDSYRHTGLMASAHERGDLKPRPGIE